MFGRIPHIRPVGQATTTSSVTTTRRRPQLPRHLHSPCLCRHRSRVRRACNPRVFYLGCLFYILDCLSQFFTVFYTFDRAGRSHKYCFIIQVSHYKVLHPILRFSISFSRFFIHSIELVAHTNIVLLLKTNHPNTSSSRMSESATWGCQT